MEREGSLYFYPPIIKNLFLVLMCLVFMVFGIAVGVSAFWFIFSTYLLLCSASHHGDVYWRNA